VVAPAGFALGRVVGGRTADVLAVTGLIPLAGATYAGLLWWLKIEGARNWRHWWRQDSRQNRTASR